MASDFFGILPIVKNFTIEGLVTMPWVKGQSGNPAGVNAREERMKKLLRDLTPRAIARLGQIMESEDEQAALGAIKEVLNRALGMPRRQVDVDVQVSGHVAHHQVLLDLANAARQRVIEGRADELLVHSLVSGEAVPRETADIGREPDAMGFPDPSPNWDSATVTRAVAPAQPGLGGTVGPAGQAPPGPMGPPAPPAHEHLPPAPRKKSEKKPPEALEKAWNALDRLPPRMNNPLTVERDAQTRGEGSHDD